MNGTQAQTIQHTNPSRETVFSSRESILRVAAAFVTIALAIVGLAGVWPTTMAAIASIILAGSVLAESGFSFSEWNRHTVMASEEEFSAKMLGGVAGVVLGILALLGIAPTTLLAVAIIVFGVTFLLRDENLMGICAVVLGVLAVVGVAPATLVLVGLLSLGTLALLKGSIFSKHVTTEKLT